ncbi:hypothetical protein BJX63DRAFT_188349 [Aspergillus granulosus]|uniref:Uncharacterized protein n=1 Tax=Aspergillus granulosus TaxID=176169 RepID=A0ABR4HHU2_9EURO
MSSVWNHAPNRSMVLSLRAAHLSSRSFRKGCSYSTSFRPIYLKPLDSPTAAFLCPSSPSNQGSDLHRDPSFCEFWCSSRFLQSRLNREFIPASKAPEPRTFTPGSHQGNRDPRSREVKPVQSKHGCSPKNGFDKKLGTPNQPSHEEPSPSEYLIDTIQKVVLSRNGHAENWTISGKNRKTLISPLTPKQRLAFKKVKNGSLQEALADYIQHVYPVLQKGNDTNIPKRPRVAPALENAMQRMPWEDHVEYLAARGYDIRDVMAWAWVLMSDDTYQATLRILLLEADQAANRNKSQQIPTFIPLMLLRQELDLKTFRLLLLYSLHTITGQPIPPLDPSPGTSSDAAVSLHDNERANAEPSIDASTCSILVVRLLSQARQLWPEAQLSIAQAFAFYLRSSKTLGSSFITEKLNMCLRLISLPSGPRPFISASVRQQAQFELLKAMADKSPALPVTRRGYQGLTAVQLAHKKTAAERESAKLKTPSWPPWKEERSGMDTTKGIEGMKSRAMRVMSQMREAGYSPSLWEKATSISAGWDTDKSPTVQTRTLVRPPEALHGRARNENHSAIWEARIRSTRTVREAWACFMAYESRGLPPHSAVYTAMGEKLVFQRKIHKQLGQTSNALPGDGPEVFPEPASVRDWIYTPSEPPTLSFFLQRMLSHGIRPSGRFLASLLHHAPSFIVGLDCLNCSDLSNEQLKALFSVEAPESDAEYQEALDQLPEYLVSAFIRFLCRFSVVSEKSLKIDIATAEAFPILTGHWARIPSHIPTLFSFTDQRRKPKKIWYTKLRSHAINLLRRRDSQNPQGWIQLLGGLRSIRILGDPSRLSRHTQMILAWHEILEILKWLEERDIATGSEGFQILCNSFSNAITAGVKDPEALERGLDILLPTTQRDSELPTPTLSDIVNRGLITLKDQFDRLVLLDPKTSSLFDSLRLSLDSRTESQVTVPALPHVPSPAVLHAFVRSLGLVEDSEGMLNLLRWMSRHALTLKQASDEYMNGDVLMRRTIVALRMFLEGYWGKRRLPPKAYDLNSAVTPSDAVPTFSDPILQEAYDIVTATEIWGPWPSDEEVWEYLVHKEQDTE